MALANIMAAVDCQHWKPRNINIALPDSGNWELEDFLRSEGYTRWHQVIPQCWKQSVKRSTIWCRPFNMTEIWVTKSIDRTVFPVVFGSTSTAMMTLITGHRIFNCYPALIEKRERCMA